MNRPVAMLALLLATILLFFPANLARAQEETVWLQVEAHPDLAVATDRARAYASLFPETAGFGLRSGWFAIVLGPYPEAEARIRLDVLQGDGQIPDDSFIAYGRDFGDQFWGTDSAAAPLQNPVETAEPDPATAAEPIAPPDETRQEARDGEALLTSEERMELQTAMQWFGFYPGGIDGAFGPGTRNAMAAWQEAQGMAEPTGVLTTRQRRALIDAWKGELSAFGFSEVIEAESGITVTLPLGLVEFDHYEPPFVHFRATDATAPRIVLISQPGDPAALSGLYDVLQSLESIPLDGARDLGERSFRIRGTNAEVDTTVFAELKGGRIKGWMLISAPGNDARDARILRVLEDSFKPDGESVLDPGIAPMDAGTKAGLLSGLEVRKPRFSRTGFFITSDGLVLTTVEAVAGCGRVTIDRSTEAAVTLTDAGAGLAVLTPKAPLAPRVVAGIATAPTRLGSEITVSGYSYEDRLPAPVLTFGSLEDVTGLNGETGLSRLALQALPGDAGGPVLNGEGAVIGMLLAAGPQGGKQLPPGVAFALSGAEITRLLSPGGTVLLPPTGTGPLSPAALADTATGMTALVSCWD